MDHPTYYIFVVVESMSKRITVTCPVLIATSKNIFITEIICYRNVSISTAFLIPENESPFGRE